MKESRNRNRNLAASVRQRLKNLATAQREDFQAILTQILHLIRQKSKPLSFNQGLTGSN